MNAVARGVSLETRHPALGFGYIASTLRQRFGARCLFKVITGNIAGNIRRFQPDIVAITTVSKNFNVAKAHASIAKQFKLPVLIGGVHVSFLPETLTVNIDIGVIGEGDKTMVELIALYIANGKFDKAALYNIHGIVFRDKGQLVQTMPRQFIKNLDTIPYPARDLLTIQKSAHMLSSRGCPYHCAFCSATKVTGNQTRYASADYVVGEMEHIYSKYKIHYLTVYDEQFALNSKRVIEIQALMAKKNLIGKFRMAINIRSDFVTEELAELFSQMNVDVVALGAESGSQKTLDYLKCGSLKVEDNIKAIEILKKHKLRTYCSFVIGSPDETKADLMETVKFIIANKLHWFEISILVPFPGTEVWDYALSVGKVSIDMDWSRLDFFIKPESVLLSKHLSIEEMTQIRAKIIAKREAYLYRYGLMLALQHPIFTFKTAFEAIKNKIKRR